MKPHNSLSAAVRRCVAALMCLAVLTAALGLYAPSAYAEADGAAAVSPSDLPDVPVADSEIYGAPADFVRVAAVPANVDIPDFYQQVINVSGMYIFTLPDGTIYKRIYGAVDDVYGWYEPMGQDNTVYENSPLIDTEADALLYYAAVSEADREAMIRQDYSGLLPPEEGVTEVEVVQGVLMGDITFYCVAGVVGLCLLITVGALLARSSARNSRNRFRHR